MHWSYRIMRHEEDGDTWYELHEYLFEGKKVLGWTENGIAQGGTVKELIGDLSMMLSDAKRKLPVLDYKTGKAIRKL